MNTARVRRSTLLALFVAVAGCSPDSAGSPAGNGRAAPAASPSDTLPNGLFLASAPAGAEDLLKVKAKAKAGDEVAFRCRIGGRTEPFVAGRAIMVVIDPSLPSCADTHGDRCPHPWDYCCETPETLVASTATVQLVDGAGQPLHASLENSRGLAPLAWITVAGVVADSAEGSFVVNATGIYVEKKG